jgi:hypothetical protein
MARRLKNLRITEVSSVDLAANPGSEVLIYKADRPKKPKRPRNLFELQEHARAAARAAQETPKMAILKKMLKAYAKGYRRAGPPPPPPPLDTAKLAARVEKGLARGEPFERAATAALRKSMASPGGEPETFAGVHPQMANTAITDASSAYNRMMEKAQEVADATGETREAAFERVYRDPRNRAVVEQDKAQHFLRATKAAGPLTGSTGAGLRPDQQPNYRKPVVGDELSKRIVKALKRDPSLTFEAAATAALRGKAA